jgi:hypothetical protein
MAKFTLLEEQLRAIDNGIILRDQLLYDIYLDTGGGSGEGSWAIIGNTLTEQGIFGTLNGWGVDIYANGAKNGEITSTGNFVFGLGPDIAKQTVYGKNGEMVSVYNAPQIKEANAEVITTADFDNLTSPLNVVIDISVYPELGGKCFANIFIKIDDEVMRCSLAWVPDISHRNLTFERGVAGTAIAAHPIGSIINFVNQYALSTDNEGRNGMGTNLQKDVLELHIKNGLNGGLSIYRDDQYQLSNGNYGGLKPPAPYKGVCQFFFHEGAAFGIRPYDRAGNLQDPAQSIHIGYDAGGFLGGIRMDATQADIQFTGGNGFGGLIECSVTGLGYEGWIKVRGNSAYYDLTGKAFLGLRIGGCFTKDHGKGLSLVGYSVVATVESWDTMLKIDNNTGGACNLDLIPTPSTGNLTIGGVTCASGSFTTVDGKTVTVTKGLIVSIV